MTKADERGKLSRRLYVSLPTWEISIWTGSWVFGVGYAIYQLFLASKRLWRLLEQQDFEQGYLTGVRQDVSDTEWFTFTKCFATTIKFIILHFIGTQFFQRQNPKALTIFHFCLSLLHVLNVVGIRPTIFLMSQPLLMFVIGKTFKSTWIIWGASLGIIFMMNGDHMFGINDWVYAQSEWMIRYVTTVIMFWVNSRCVSYCLDNAWGDVIEDETSSKTWQFLKWQPFAFMYLYA